MKPSYRIAELERIGDAFRQRAIEAERERDEYKHRCKVSDGACAIAEKQRDHWMQRAKVAEAEIARRDAVAGEPVAWKWRLISLDDESQIGPWRLCLAPLTPGKGTGYKTEAIPLYTVAQPAVLPDIDKYTHGLWPHAVEQLIRFRDDALALGAQQHKPVVIPDLPHDCDRTEAHFKYIAALDAAGVKHKVVK